MSRRRSLLLVISVWAIGYLPALGSLQLRGEEARRVLPAVAMMEGAASAGTAREVLRAFIVPQVAGRAYLRKPPLVNWLIVTSFKLSGYRNAWMARLPSALFVLGAATVFVIVARPQLGPNGSIVAALSWLTSLGILQKGRMIEIDAIYTSLFAVAFICWLAWWLQKRSAALTWMVPLVFLGLALLAKGPAAVLFFYALVLAVLWQTGRMGDLFDCWHGVGVLLMFGIFGLWAVPLVIELGATGPLGTWSEEMFLPVAGREVLGLTHWFLNIPRGATLFLPAALLLPFIRADKLPDTTLRAGAQALFRTALVLFVAILLLPGSYPKYALPLIPVMCWLLGLAVAHNAFVFELQLSRGRIAIPRRFAVGATAILAAVALIAVPLQAATFPESRQRVKRNAERINAAVPTGEPLFIIDAPHESFLFYVRAPLRYVDAVEDLPPQARYVLARAREQASIQTSERWRASSPRLLTQTDAPAQHVQSLYELEALR